MVGHAVLIVIFIRKGFIEEAKLIGKIALVFKQYFCLIKLFVEFICKASGRESIINFYGK
jgi:hypothetical protein